MTIEICVHKLQQCPYCGSKQIKEERKMKPAGYLVHAVICEQCAGIFFVPCED